MTYAFDWSDLDFLVTSGDALKHFLSRRLEREVWILSNWVNLFNQVLRIKSEIYNAICKHIIFMEDDFHVVFQSVGSDVDLPDQEPTRAVCLQLVMLCHFPRKKKKGIAKCWPSLLLICTYISLLSILSPNLARIGIHKKKLKFPLCCRFSRMWFADMLKKQG